MYPLTKLIDTCCKCEQQEHSGALTGRCHIPKQNKQSIAKNTRFTISSSLALSFHNLHLLLFKLKVYI